MAPIKRVLSFLILSVTLTGVFCMSNEEQILAQKSQVEPVVVISSKQKNLGQENIQLSKGPLLSQKPKSQKDLGQENIQLSKGPLLSQNPKSQKDLGQENIQLPKNPLLSQKPKSSKNEQKKTENEVPGPSNTEDPLYMSRFHKLITPLLDVRAKCNPQLLQALGVSTPSYSTPRIADVDEKAFCRRNRYTCCSATDLASTQGRFVENSKKFIRTFQAVEELLTLFKGKAYEGLYKTLQKKSKCVELVKDLTDTSGKKVDFFSASYTKRRVDEANSLLNEIEVYLKRELWFHGNVLCAACNPRNSDHFILEKGKSTIKVLMNTCSDMLEGFEFELRLAQSYNSYFKILADLIKCSDDAKPGSKPEILPISVEKLEKMETDFHQCLNNFKENENSCLRICSKNIARYTPFVDFLVPYRNALKIIYKKFTDQDIEEYYETIYQKEFPGDEVEAIEFFDEKNEKWQEFKLSALEWDYDTEGANIFNDHMSKKFIRVNTAEIY